MSQTLLTTESFVRSYTELPASIANPDRVNMLIMIWSNIVTNYCGVPFEKVETTLYLDGNGGRTLFLGWPIIQISALRVNGAVKDTDPVLDTEMYAYSTKPGNPTITLKEENDRNLFYRITTTFNGKFVFTSGPKNQRVDGTFGRVDTTGPQVDDDGEPVEGAPLMVQSAIARLVALDARGVIRDPVGILRTDIIEEWTDGHRLIFNQRTKRNNVDIPDPVAASWLAKFKRPLAMAAPGFRGPGE